MYPEQPSATAVAVRDGRILAVGDLQNIVYWLKQSPFQPYEVDTVFRDKVIIPGLVDPHTHVDLQALIYSGHFVAQIPWPRPEGGFYPTYRTKADVLERLAQLDRELPPGELLYGVAYDENKAGGFLNIDDLDRVSQTRPVLVSNVVCHRFWVNSFLLRKAGIDQDNPPPQLQKGPDGKPDGTLIEFEGLACVISAIPELVTMTEKKTFFNPAPFHGRRTYNGPAKPAWGPLGVRSAIKLYQSLLANPDVKLRIIGLPWWKTGIAETGSLEQFIELYREARAADSDKFRIGAVKLYLDGSIISHTTPIGWPGLLGRLC